MKLIVAVDREWNIGNKGDLLFRLPLDMKFFRTQTSGKIVVMGRKTLESFPNSKPLKNRVNIVLSRDKNYSVEGAVVVADTDELKDVLKQYDTDDVYVIGGEAIYRLLLPLCDTALITHVDAVAGEADKKFPKLSEDEWLLNKVIDETVDNGYNVRWCEYVRK